MSRRCNRSGVAVCRGGRSAAGGGRCRGWYIALLCTPCIALLCTPCIALLCTPCIALLLTPCIALLFTLCVALLCTPASIPCLTPAFGSVCSEAAVTTAARGADELGQQVGRLASTSRPASQLVEGGRGLRCAER